MCYSFATQRWDKPNITDMADAAVDGRILCFEVPLVKAGIDALLIKEDLSEWNEYGKQILYRIDIVPTGVNQKRRPVIYSKLLLILLNLCYTEFNYPTVSIFSILTMMAYQVC